MAKINGNTTAVLQVKDTDAKNQINEAVPSWLDLLTLSGWLDLQSGDSTYITYSAKVQEATHIFICDYQDLEVTPENSRMIINRMVYEILLIDNPMELNRHLEIYLKSVGFYFGK